MSRIKSLADGASRKKLLSSCFVGGLVGYVGSRLLFRFTDYSFEGNSSAVLSTVGLAYLAIALFVGIGTLFPKFGAKVLNVEDEEEVAEQRSSMASGSLVNGTLGIIMIILANSGTGSAWPFGVVLGMVLVSIAAFTIVTVKGWSQHDELMRQVTHEAGSISGALIIPSLLLWGTCAMYGVGPDFEPKLIIALIMGITLLSAFIATGLRGMLNPR